MSQAFNKSVTFVLNKAYLVECFEQTAPPVQRKDYNKAVIFGFLTFALVFIEADHYYILFFLLGLTILEIFSITYRKTWWVWRQLMGKSANGKIKLTFNETGIITESSFVNSQIFWQDVKHIKQKANGILLEHQDGKNYLSNSHLNKEIIEFILNHKVAE